MSNAIPKFADKIKETNTQFNRLPLTTLQINIGLLCNQTCLHCHVESGPHKKKENMQDETVKRILSVADNTKTIQTVDITGGAPELNPYFRDVVKHFRSQGKEVIDRCNLTVLFEEGQEDTATFLADNQVKVVASLPCYSRDNVEKQRGDGVFDRSIRALQNLNELGYGREGSGLTMDLVYNPVGPHLPPPQETLLTDYKKALKEDFGIEFNNLYTITNMPIKRFLFDLKKSKKYDEYMTLLHDNFNKNAAEAVMCRSLVSVSWDGYLFDCDFNQALSIPIASKKTSVFDIESFDEIADFEIATASHCYGCTAGAGSSCGGALV